jgi:hypothetical protein
MTDNRKSTITAKVAAQIVEYYRQALKNIEPFLGAIKKAKVRAEKYFANVALLLMVNECRSCCDRELLLVGIFNICKVLPQNESLVAFVYLEIIGFLSKQINRISGEITGLKVL